MVSARRITTWLRRLLIASIAMILVGGILLGTSQMVLWDGWYEQAEYRLRFIDANGTPVHGVQLRVEDRQGADAPGFPVSDYGPGNVVASNGDGLLVFRHIRRARLETGGQCLLVLFVIPIGSCRYHDFTCRFFYGDREVYRVAYDDLNRAAVDAIGAPGGSRPPYPSDQFVIVDQQVQIRVP